MKVMVYSALAALALAGALSAASPAAARTCIKTRDIVNSSSKDGRTIDFTMRNGTVLRNHLQGVCSDLRFNGFVWVVRGGDQEVCEGMQSLRVLHSGQVCVLGKFDPPRPKAVKPAHPG
jgi:hypothetical protein